MGCRSNVRQRLLTGEAAHHTPKPRGHHNCQSLSSQASARAEHLSLQGADAKGPVPEPLAAVSAG